MVGLPPPKGTRLKRALVAAPSASMPMEAGCGRRLTATVTARFFASLTRSSRRLKGLSRFTNTTLSSMSVRQKYW
jgi:hypothetical protein